MNIDLETEVILLRVAVVASVIFGIFGICGYKAASSHAFLKGLLGLLAAPRRSIHVGLVIRSDRTGVHGNFSLPVLWIITVGVMVWYVVHPMSFFVVLGFPVSIMTASTFSRAYWTSPWLTPFAVLVTIIVFWCGFIFAIVFWGLVAAIVFKAFSWFSEIVMPHFSKRVFDVLALGLLAISGVLTFILI
jgi:hypothetical protein